MKARLGEIPPRIRTVAVLVAGLGGGMTAAIQPILLGALAREGQITPLLLARLATTEFIAMGIMAAIAGAWLRPTRLRLVAASAACGAILANLMTPHLPLPLMFVARAICGLSGGTMLWLLVGLVARSPAPSRLAAIYILFQTSACFSIAFLLGHLVLPRGGVAGGYGFLATVGGVILIASCLIPRAYPALASGGPEAPWSKAGYVGLLAVMSLFAANMSAWVFSGPLAGFRGFDRSQTEAAQTIAIGAQIFGGAAALLLAERLTARAVLMIAGCCGLVITGGLFVSTSLAAFTIFYSAMGFCWMAAVPFAVSYLLGLDQSGRAVALVAPAQIVGNAGGPFLASLMLMGSDVRPALLTSMALYGTTLASMRVARRLAA